MVANGNGQILFLDLEEKKNKKKLFCCSLTLNDFQWKQKLTRSLCYCKNNNNKKRILISISNILGNKRDFTAKKKI